MTRPRRQGRASLHVVPALPVLPVLRPRRPSLIVQHGASMTPPWTPAQHDVMERGPVPMAVVRAMWVSAWAAAERCPLSILPQGWLQPDGRDPSDDLSIAVLQCMADVVGALGFGVPIRLDCNRRAVAATWPQGEAS